MIVPDAPPPGNLPDIAMTYLLGRSSAWLAASGDPREILEMGAWVALGRPEEQNWVAPIFTHPPTAHETPERVAARREMLGFAARTTIWR